MKTSHILHRCHIIMRYIRLESPHLSLISGLSAAIYIYTFNSLHYEHIIPNRRVKKASA